MMVVGLKKLLFLISLLLAAAMAATEAQSLAGCPDKCGDVDIPYPFGVGTQPGTSRNCFLDQSFNLTCVNNSTTTTTSSTTTLYFNNYTVSNISLQQSQIEISMTVFQACSNRSGKAISLYTESFTVSSTQNKFLSVGCDALAIISFFSNFTYSSGCVALCNKPPPKEINDKTCSGTGCCQVDIPKGMNNISFAATNVTNYTSVSAFNNCTTSFIAKNGWFSFSPDYLGHFPFDRAPLVLDWSVSNVTCHTAPSNLEEYACKFNTVCVDSSDGTGYTCKCKPGFEGNPYHPDGCQDVDECSRHNNCSMPKQCRNLYSTYHCSCPPGYKGDGYTNGTGCTLDTTRPNRQSQILIIALAISVALLVVITLISTLCWAHKQRTLKQLRLRNFEQNGGYMLLQQLSQHQECTDITKIYTEVELKNATNNFDECRILGRGGQGTVYKGILPDTTLVAIKKSKVGGDPRQIKDFINEVFVLSQINHRHVVKLLGCCLETDIPLLVYEFVDNGTLLDHLDPLKTEFSSIPWEIRLRVATETAGAVSYLHSSASIPIIHRDIKSTNILLDHNLRAKVADFGASRLVPLEESHITTVIQGTLGYLDPEYLHVGQLNDKSDVYSFGVVLVELLTGNKAVEFKWSEQKNLAMHFVSSMRENRLWEILDRRLLLKQKNYEQMKVVALLARRCVRVKGEERPTMKEVAMELEGLIAVEKHPWMYDNKDLMSEESEYLLGHVPHDYRATGASTSASYDSMVKEIASEIEDGR